MGHLCAIGDVHGHLQLALGIAARWQLDLGQEFDAVLLCGDVGTFTDEEKLDKATHRHAKENPCEVEFLTQWMDPANAPWLEGIFRPVSDNGLGLACPILMVHGNHDGFDHLEQLVEATSRNQDPIPVDRLPWVDPLGRIRYLPSGWRSELTDGTVIGGIGGIEPGQRTGAGYHPMAYITEDAITSIAEGPPVDVLITHQGPAEAQGLASGSDLLDIVLEAERARVWCHGHSIDDLEIRRFGRTTVVPLRDATFVTRGNGRGYVRLDSWCRIDISYGSPAVDRRRPAGWAEFHRAGWRLVHGNKLVAPSLAVNPSV